MTHAEKLQATKALGLSVLVVFQGRDGNYVIYPFDSVASAEAIELQGDFQIAAIYEV